MQHTTPTALLFACLALACSRKPTPSGTPPQPAVPSAMDQTRIEPTASPSPNSDAQATACQPTLELAELDGRRPVPLQPVMAWHQKQSMMDHLVTIQKITAALAEENWDAIASAAAQIQTSPQMQQTCQHMGAGADGFTELALDFHRRADGIGLAASKHDAKAVLNATSSTLQACTGCHGTFRQHVVDAAEWQRLTGMGHDPSMGHGQR